MEWYVFRHNVNSQQIERWNVFDHGRFREDVLRCLKKHGNREEFAEALRKELFYYYGMKSEWEVLIAPWVGGKITNERKVDVYTQVRLNWDAFVEYVWGEKK